jgi:PAS domain S-box-containing protein
VAVSAIPIGIIGGIQGFKYTSMLLIGLIFLVTFIVSLTISIYITRPIERLTKNINEISKGKLDVNLSSSELYEINNLVNSLNRIMASLKLAIHKVGVKKGEIFEDAIKTKEETEKKQKEILNSIKGWAWEVDSKGNFTFCSDNIKKILGFHAKEVMGKSIFDFVAAEDVKNFRNTFIESSKKKQPILNFEKHNIHRSGEKMCVVTNCFPVYDNFDNFVGYRGVDNDITSEKIYELKVQKLDLELTELKTEMADLLNEYEKRYDEKIHGLRSKSSDKNAKWLEHDMDSVLIFDENANILDCNTCMVNSLGYSKDEMLSQNIADFDVLDSKDEIIRKINKTKKNGSLTFKTIHQKKDGSAILVHENFQYIPDKNRYKAIVRQDYFFKKTQK